jgi:hypothetical protein
VQQLYSRERRHRSNVDPQPAGRPFETELKHKRILPTLCAELSSAAALRYRALEWLALRPTAASLASHPSASGSINHVMHAIDLQGSLPRHCMAQHGAGATNDRVDNPCCSGVQSFV